MTQHRMMRIWAILTAIGAYLMLLMGAIVSATGSGRGCGSTWPFCHGQLIPESMPVDTVIEYSHRVISGIDGFFILILTVWSWVAFKTDRRVKILGFMSLFFVVLQGALGALTVVFERTFAKQYLLALHFGFSLISFASVILLTIYLFQLKKGTARRKENDVSKKMKLAIWGLAAFTYVVVYTGALVRHAGATMGCGYLFPLCGSTYFPNLSSLAGIHMLHRYAALILWLLVLNFLVVVLRRYRMRRDLVFGSWISFILVTLQAVSGVMIVMTGGKLLTELLHTTIISAFFCALTYLCMQAGWPWDKERETVPVAKRPAIQ
jgi:cytochrome c oxidase assembly protein subunit 15